MQQFICGAIGFKTAVSRALPKVWPMRSDCDLERLSSARIPVLALIGRDESANNGPKAATRFRQRLPEARIELVDDANHMVMVDQFRDRGEAARRLPAVTFGICSRDHLASPSALTFPGIDHDSERHKLFVVDSSQHSRPDRTC